ncbi:MAG: TfoX/Sxy family protein [Vicinamibacterales bacterium]
MSYSEDLAERVRRVCVDHANVTEKAMFGGVCFMSDGHMFIGIVGDTLMARIGPDAYQRALDEPHVREMDFTGRPMRGYVYVEPEGCATVKSLRRWVNLAASFVSSLPPKKVRPAKA